MSKLYPTDLTDTQWQYIEKTLLFEERKRKHELKEIWNAVFYLAKTGYQMGNNKVLNNIDDNKKVKGSRRYVVVDKTAF